MSFVIETLAYDPDRRAAKADAEEWRVRHPDHRFHPAGWTHLALVRVERFEEVEFSHAGNGTNRRRYRLGAVRPNPQLAAAHCPERPVLHESVGVAWLYRWAVVASPQGKTHPSTVQRFSFRSPRALQPARELRRRSRPPRLRPTCRRTPAGRGWSVRAQLAAAGPNAGRLTSATGPNLPPDGSLCAQPVGRLRSTAAFGTSSRPRAVGHDRPLPPHSPLRLVFCCA
jgi:hypothetical protein